MHITEKRLNAVNKLDLIHFMNHPKVCRYLPRVAGKFDEASCDLFIKTDEFFWLKCGFGLSAFFVDDRLIGWGGLQPHRGLPAKDGKMQIVLHLVLHPDYWGTWKGVGGLGMQFLDQLLKQAFEDLDLNSVCLLFFSLRRERSIMRVAEYVGFIWEGKVKIKDRDFFLLRKYAIRDPALNVSSFWDNSEIG